MDEAHIDYCRECIKDHEVRLREIESNNKEQVKLYVEREKLDIRINSLDEKCDVRFNSLEKWMEARILTLTTENKIEKKESRSDVYAMIGMLISIGTFLVLIWKLT
jgi:hypothetical protein